MQQHNIREVARRAGVSVGTVSNVLNRPDLVAEATRARVREAIEELGFVPNESARRLRQGPPPIRTRAFGVVVQDVANPYCTDVARGAESAMNAVGRDAIWVTSDGSPDKEQRSLDLLAEQGVSGTLITPVELGPEGIDRLRTRGMAIVLLDRAYPGAACSARVDHVAGGAIAATRLLEAGHERLVFVTGAPAAPPCRDRQVGAARAMARFDAPPLRCLAQGAMTATAGRQAARRLLELRPTATGVFCANDLLAIGLVNELLRLGVRVPDDLAVIGYDDIELAATAVVPLTTVRQPRHELGRAAAELALAEISEGENHVHRAIVLAPDLVVRESA